MKLQIDTTLKTIKIEESINLNELIEAIQRLLPDDLWKEFKLETNTHIIWNEPFVIKPYNPYNPYIPFNPWIVTYGTSQSQLNQGVYNVQC